MQEGKLWLAGRELQKLTVLPTENQLSVEAMDQDFHGDVFDAPLASAGEILDAVDDPHLVTEVGAFNLELNLDPQPSVATLQRLEDATHEHLARVRSAANERGVAGAGRDPADHRHVRSRAANMVTRSATTD